MKLGELLTKTTEYFKNKNFESARLDAELLISYQMKWERIKIYMNLDYPMTEKEMTPLRELVKRRAQGEPIAYITSEKYFYKDRFYVEPGVLIPRPETELIVEEAKALLEENAEGYVCDLGCGSGCIGLSILADHSQLKLVGFDVSEKAIEISQKNAAELNRSERSLFILKNLSSDFPYFDDKQISKDQIKLVVSNPPYIAHGDPLVQKSVHDFEPHIALYSDEGGLDHAQKWLQQLGRELVIGTFVIFEMGKGQELQLKSFAEAHGFEFIKFVKDYSGVLRHLVVKKL